MYPSKGRELVSNRSRLIGLTSALIVALAIFVLGTWIETRIFNGLTNILQNQTFLSIILFFSVVNLNAILAFLLIFLSFRNAVKLVVERQQAIFGSFLRTRLVTLFLFFSLVPTLILLYVSTKFFNAHFDQWLPPNVEKTTHQSFQAESEYRDKIFGILSGMSPPSSNEKLVDFVLSLEDASEKKDFVQEKYENLMPHIRQVIFANESQIKDKPKWMNLLNSRSILVTRRGDHFFGFVIPQTIHTQWQLLSLELTQAQPGVELVRLGYYILVGGVSVLLIFSALWLGVTIARELTGPLQSLALATELVAAGNYEVKIDDINSDDELGQLARSFRAMVFDLRETQQRARASAHELEVKAAQLSEKTEYYASVLQEIQASVLSVDENLRIEACNPAAERLLLMSEFSARGRPLGELLPRDFYLNWFRPLLLPLIDERERRIVGEFSGKIFARDCQIVVTAHALLKPNKEKAFLIIIEDVTDIARAQRLAAWREVARKVAHEIKNPLTPILLGAQRLERRILNKVEGEEHAIMKESLRVIVHSSDTIKQLVDEFVSVARMAAPQLRLGDILETLQLTVAGFSENPDQVVVELQVWDPAANAFALLTATTPRPQLFLKYDPEQMNRVFINLISNAIAASVDFEEHRRVVLRVRGATEEKREAEFAVIDWGHGIPESMRERIFEPYFSTKRSGTGLGLVIVQQIVHEHGGHLWVSSNEPRGTVFSISLPV